MRNLLTAALVVFTTSSISFCQTTPKGVTPYKCVDYSTLRSQTIRTNAKYVNEVVAYLQVCVNSKSDSVTCQGYLRLFSDPHTDMPLFLNADTMLSYSYKGDRVGLVKYIFSMYQKSDLGSNTFAQARPAPKQLSELESIKAKIAGKVPANTLNERAFEILATINKYKAESGILAAKKAETAENRLSSDE